MLRLRVLDILEEQGHSKYWLFVRMELSYRNFDNLIKNKTTGIRFENIEKLCYYLNCEPDDLFEVIPDEKKDAPAKDENVGQATRAARTGTRKKSVRQLEKEAAAAAKKAAEKAAIAKAAREKAEAEAAAKMPPAPQKPKTIREINIWKS